MGTAGEISTKERGGGEEKPFQEKIGMSPTLPHSHLLHDEEWEVDKKGRL